MLCRQGRNLTLLAMDDGYDPTVSVENFQAMSTPSPFDNWIKHALAIVFALINY